MRFRGPLIDAIKKSRKHTAERKEENLTLGGSKKAEADILRYEGARTLKSYEKSDKAQERLNGQADKAAGIENINWGGYGGAKFRNEQALTSQAGSIAGIGAGAGQASSILGAAQGSKQLTGTAEGVLAQRAAAINAAPGYGQLADQAILANQQNARAQTNFAQGQLARQAMGVATGQGEGGALAGQQAMASLVGAGGNMAVQSNLAQAQLAADTRNQASLAQRQETVGEAGYASDARMGTAAQERANQMATAGKQAELAYNSGLANNAAQAAYTGATQAGMNTAGSVALGSSQQAGNLATVGGTQAAAREGMHTDAYGNLLAAKLNAGTQREANQDRPAWKQALFPMGMLGGT